MAAHALLNGAIDGKHRARIWEDGRVPHVLRTRAPAHNLMIHPAWVDRYVPENSYIVLYLVAGNE